MGDKASPGLEGARPWWERFPDRYRDELKALNAAGIRYEIDREAEARGVLRLRVFPLVNGEELPLDVEFPRSYPYFRFEVMAPTLDLEYHQHPFGKALCLLPRATKHWRPASDRLAHFLVERLPQALELATAENVDSDAREEHQAEPFTDYYQYHPDTLLLIDGAWRLPADVQCGSLVIGVETLPSGEPHVLLRGAVLVVKDAAGHELVRAPEALAERFPQRVTGGWARCTKPPKTLHAGAIFAEADSRLPPGVKRKAEGWAVAGNSRVTVRAVVFPEEVHWRGERRDAADGWVAAVRVDAVVPLLPKGTKLNATDKQLYRALQQRRDKGADFYLARVWRAGPTDMRERVPELVPLANATIAVFGGGCLGGPSTLEFSRAMVGEVRLLDHDVIDPATTVRWPLGMSAAGRFKTAVLESVIRRDFPYTRVLTSPVKIGATGGVDIDEWAALDDMLTGATLLYDATAEPGVQYFLADLARDRGIPYVSVSGTQGGWGGIVVRIRPGSTEGCWMCLQHAFENDDPAYRDFSIRRPAFDESRGDVQPQGCADPTYTGANFDLGEVALMGVRTAVSTLTAGNPGGYPPMAWDVAVLTLRDPEGRLTPPTWVTHQLRRHPACPVCNRAGA